MRDGQEFFDANELDSFVIDFAGDYGAQLHVRPRNETGEPETADRCAVPFGVLGHRACEARPIGAHQFEARYMTSKRSGYMVILSMNVIGNSATDSDEFCPRGGREKPSAWNGEIQNIGETDACFATEQPALWVEGNQAREACGAEERAALEQTNVAVATTQAYWQHGFTGGGRQREVGGPM